MLGTASNTMAASSGVWKQVKSFHLDTQQLLTVIEAAMLMETFDRLSRKEKYIWDVRALHSNGFSAFNFLSHRCTDM